VSQNDEVVVFHGPQGGWHIDTAVQVGNIEGNMTVFITPRIYLASDMTQLAGDDPNDFQAVALVPQDACNGEIWQVRALVDDLWPSWPSTEEVCAWEGQNLIVELEVEDVETGRKGTDQVSLVASMAWENGPFDCSPYQN
jgi:hypothetical protein